MSIIIVGVGNDEFTAMDELDSDNVRLSVNGRYAERDIVQVCFYFQNASFLLLVCAITKFPIRNNIAK